MLLLLSPIKPFLFLSFVAGLGLSFLLSMSHITAHSEDYFSGVFIVFEENQTETLPRKKKRQKKLKTVSSMHGAIAPFGVTSNAERKWRSVRHSRGPPINSNESLTSIS